MKNEPDTNDYQRIGPHGKTWRCLCIGYHWLDVDYFDEDGELTFCFTLVHEPTSLWDRFRAFFERRYISREVLLTEEHTQELLDALTKWLAR